MAAYHAIPNAERTLMAGFTTVRDLGSQHFMDVALRDAIAKGSSRAAHARGDQRHRRDRRPFRSLERFSRQTFRPRTGLDDGIADGPEAIRKAVRFEVKNGADVIKAAVSGGVLSMKMKSMFRNLRRKKWPCWSTNRIACARKSRCIVMATPRRAMRSMPASILSSTVRL